MISPQIEAADKNQPIAFSHQIHATDNEIPCQYCHLYARRSFSSGVPPMSTCIGCHGTMDRQLVAPNTEESNKVRQYWDDQQPIPWVKIHDVQDFVRFPHKKHVNADPNRFLDEAGTQCDENADPRSLDCRIKLFKQGGDDVCAACHGDVKNMEVVQQVDANFAGMGWCLECHLQVKGAKARKSELSTLRGWFDAKAMNEEREKLIGLTHPDKGYHHPNLTDCYTCHY